MEPALQVTDNSQDGNRALELVCQNSTLCAQLEVQQKQVLPSNRSWPAHCPCACCCLCALGPPQHRQACTKPQKTFAESGAGNETAYMNRLICPAEFHCKRQRARASMSMPCSLPAEPHSMRARSKLVRRVRSLIGIVSQSLHGLATADHL